jgi:hypothetical protein
MGGSGVAPEERARSEQTDPHPVVFTRASTASTTFRPTRRSRPSGRRTCSSSPASRWRKTRSAFSSTSTTPGVAADDFETIYRQQGFIYFAIFGWERANPRLTVNYRPITQAEIDAEKKTTRTFTPPSTAPAPPPALAYVVVRPTNPADAVQFCSHRPLVRARRGRARRHDIIYRVRLRD